MSEMGCISILSMSVVSECNSSFESCVPFCSIIFLETTEVCYQVVTVTLMLCKFLSTRICDTAQSPVSDGPAWGGFSVLEQLGDLLPHLHHPPIRVWKNTYHTRPPRPAHWEPNESPKQQKRLCQLRIDWLHHWVKGTLVWVWEQNSGITKSSRHYVWFKQAWVLHFRGLAGHLWSLAQALMCLLLPIYTYSPYGWGIFLLTFFIPLHSNSFEACLSGDIV